MMNQNVADIQEVLKAILATNPDINEADMLVAMRWAMKAKIDGALFNLLMAGRVSIGVTEEGSIGFAYIHLAPGLN